DRLAGKAQTMLHRQPRAELEQRLPIPLVQFVEDCPSSRRTERLENIGHLQIICKSRLACQDWSFSLSPTPPASDWESRELTDTIDPAAGGANQIRTLQESRFAREVRTDHDRRADMASQPYELHN